jgi:hypothetical protein
MTDLIVASALAVEGETSLSLLLLDALDDEE